MARLRPRGIAPASWFHDLSLEAGTQARGTERLFPAQGLIEPMPEADWVRASASTFWNREGADGVPPPQRR
jgi:hypothetical protein